LYRVLFEGRFIEHGQQGAVSLFLAAEERADVAVNTPPTSFRGPGAHSASLLTPSVSKRISAMFDAN
jgi:hypothetical protein